MHPVQSQGEPYPKPSIPSNRLQQRVNEYGTLLRENKKPSGDRQTGGRVSPARSGWARTQVYGLRLAGRLSARTRRGYARITPQTGRGSGVSPGIGEPRRSRAGPITSRLAGRIDRPTVGQWWVMCGVSAERPGRKPGFLRVSSPSSTPYLERNRRQGGVTNPVTPPAPPGPPPRPRPFERAGGALARLSTCSCSRLPSQQRVVEAGGLPRGGCGRCPAH